MTTKSEELAQSRRALLDHAIEYATGDISDVHAQKRRLELADAYARARWATAAGSGGRKDGKPSTSSVVLPFGRAKGKTVGEASTGDLKWVAGAVRESLSDPAKACFCNEN